MNTHTASNPARSTFYATLTLVFLVSASFFVIPASAQPAPSEDPTAQHLAAEHAMGNVASAAHLSAEEKKAFTHQLTQAISTGHDGLQQGALRQIIRYGEALSFNRSAAIDVVRIYRNQTNNRMRRMAVVALGQMNDAWANDFLTRSARYEQDPGVRHSILSVLDAQTAQGLGPAKVGG